MRYVVSDVHGNSELFEVLLNVINFSKNDKMFIVGDFIDKGKNTRKLLDLIFGKYKDNIIPLAGNHEYDLIKFVTRLTLANESDENIEKKCRLFLNENDLNIRDIDNIMNCQFVYEEDDFILVHSGVEIDSKNTVIDPELSSIESLVYSRSFNKSDVLPNCKKCIIYGHTPTFYTNQDYKIIKYLRKEKKGNGLSDFHKINIDTGNYLSGILGTLCLDTMEEIYVNKKGRV